MKSPNISICLATYRRPERLRQVLDDLSVQTLQPSQIVVVDNDAKRSAESVVAAFSQDLSVKSSSIQVIYGTQPERNISITRNRTVELSSGDWLAFIDDDERAPSNWLEQLFALALSAEADGVLGPVIPELPPDAPAWIRKGDFYSYTRFSTGQDVPLPYLRFGNVLLRAAPVRALPGPFDPAFRLSTGEDADMLIRLMAKGSRVIWHDQACVTEPVEPGRMRFDWLLKRAYSGGQEFARKTLAGSYGPISGQQRWALGLDAMGKGSLALLLAVLSLPLGRHKVAHWLIRAKANQGKLSAFRGTRFQEYR